MRIHTGDVATYAKHGCFNSVSALHNYCSLGSIVSWVQYSCDTKTLIINLFLKSIYVLSAINAISLQFSNCTITPCNNIYCTVYHMHCWQKLIVACEDALLIMSITQSYFPWDSKSITFYSWCQTSPKFANQSKLGLFITKSSHEYLCNLTLNVSHLCRADKDFWRRNRSTWS